MLICDDHKGRGARFGVTPKLYKWFFLLIQSAFSVILDLILFIHFN